MINFFDHALLYCLKKDEDMVDGAPVVVKEGVSKEEAETVKGKLEEAGATVTLK